MKKTILCLAIVAGISVAMNAQNNVFSTPSVQYQNAYFKSNGTLVEPHMKTSPNNTNLDNFSTKENYNPYNGLEGTKPRDYSREAQNTGYGQNIQTGPKGGQYYINSNGNKTYVPKK